MSRILTTLTTLALLVPGAASAAPMLWHTVPDRLAEDVASPQGDVESARSTLTDHEYALERRSSAVDEAKDYLDQAREERKMARKDARQARKGARQAKRGNGDLELATMRLTAAERNLLESKDLVALQKERIDARQLHEKLEEHRVTRAEARLEWEEAIALHDSQAEGHKRHKPARYAKQYNRVAEKAAEVRSDWEVARVEVQERYQDYASARSPMYDQVSITMYELDPSESGMDRSSPAYSDSVTYESDRSAGNLAGASLRRVHFDLGSAALDTEALNDLAWNAHVLRNMRDVSVRIEGHTDATGSWAMNRDLAWNRAEAIQQYLTEQGVWDSQVETVAFGESRPLIDTQAPTEINRRAELRVVSDPDGLVDGTIEDEEPVDLDDW